MSRPEASPEALRAYQSFAESSGNAANWLDSAMLHFWSHDPTLELQKQALEILGKSQELHPQIPWTTDYLRMMMNTVRILSSLIPGDAGE